MRTFPGCVLPALVVLAAGALLVVGCDEPIPDTWRLSAADCTDPANGTEAHFADVIKPQVLEPYCAYCHWSDKEGEDRHGATTDVIGSELDYDDYEQATSRNALTWGRVKARNMPPMGATPTADEAALLLEFLNCVEAAAGDDDDSAADDDDSAR